MVARVGGVDRDDRDMGQVLAEPEIRSAPDRIRGCRSPPLPFRRLWGRERPFDRLRANGEARSERLFRHAFRLLDHMVREFMRDTMLVDGDQAEAARRERVAEHLRDARGETRRPADLLGQDQIPDLGGAELGDGELAPFLLLDRPQPMALALAMDDAEDELAPFGELLHRMGGKARPARLGAGEDAVANAQRASPAFALEHPQSRLGQVRFPALRDGPALAVLVDVGHPQHRHPGHAAGLVEGAAGRGVDQALVGHVAQQGLERDLVVPGQAEGAGDLALAGRLVARRDEVEDLPAGGEASSGWSTSHLRSNPVTPDLIRGPPSSAQPSVKDRWMPDQVRHDDHG
jgi:hypothetical protein